MGIIDQTSQGSTARLRLGVYQFRVSRFAWFPRQHLEGFTNTVFVTVARPVDERLNPADPSGHRPGRGRVYRVPLNAILPGFALRTRLLNVTVARGMLRSNRLAGGGPAALILRYAVHWLGRPWRKFRRRPPRATAWQAAIPHNKVSCACRLRQVRSGSPHRTNSTSLVSRW